MSDVVKTIMGVGDPIVRPTRKVVAHMHMPEWSTATLPDKGGVVRVSCACGCRGRMKADVLWGSDKDNGVVV